MKYKFIFTTFLLWMVSLAGTAIANVNIHVMDLVKPGLPAGEIYGTVESCSDRFDLSGTLVHIPGLSVSTKLSSNPNFRLFSVPEGDHKLVFEYKGRVLNSVPKVTVWGNKMTRLDNITLCPDIDGDGYNLLSDLDDNNFAIHPGAKEVCDRVDNNGNGEVDEGCSYRKFPKGGKFCLNNWNNSNRIIHNSSATSLPPAKLDEAPDIVAQNNNR